MADERDSGEDQSGPRFDTGRLLLVAVLVLAVACTAVLVLTSSAQWLRLGVLGGLWASMLGVFLATRYRKQVVDREAEAAELQSVYQLELEREVAARREYELEIEAETRRRVQEESRDDLSALRAELSNLRGTLERLTGGEVLVERFALRAQGTRMRPLGGDVQPPRMVTTGDPGKARQVLAGDTINAGADLMPPNAPAPRPAARTQVLRPSQYRPEPVRPGVGVRAGAPPRRESAAAEQSNPTGIAAALNGDTPPTELVRPVGPREPVGAGSGHREPVGMNSGRREPVGRDSGMDSGHRQPVGATSGHREPVGTASGHREPVGTGSGYRTAPPDEPGRRRVAVPRPELGRPAPARADADTQRTDTRAQRPAPETPAPETPAAQSRAPEPRRAAQPVESRKAEDGSQRLDLRPRPTDSQRLDLRPRSTQPQPAQSALRPVAAEAPRPTPPRPAPVRPRHRTTEDSGAPLYELASGPMPVAPKPTQLRAVPTDPESPRPGGGGRRRAEDRPARQPEPAAPEQEESGAHTAGRSVTELLAAHGVEDTGVGRRRRRAAD